LDGEKAVCESVEMQCSAYKAAQGIDVREAHSLVEHVVKEAHVAKSALAHRNNPCIMRTLVV